jgi:hypothetical protein
MKLKVYEYLDYVLVPPLVLTVKSECALPRSLQYCVTLIIPYTSYLIYLSAVEDGHFRISCYVTQRVSVSQTDLGCLTRLVTHLSLELEFPSASLCHQ